MSVSQSEPDMSKREKVAPLGATRTDFVPDCSSFPYISGAGKCIVRQQAGSRSFVVYLVENGGPPRFFESHRNQSNAEAVARWMAMGL